MEINVSLLFESVRIVILIWCCYPYECMVPDASNAENPDRDTGLLTRKQREYLLGQTDIEAGSNRDRAMRSRIRNRVYNAFLDFSLLYEHLPADDRDRLLVPQGSEKWPAFSNGIGDTISVIYLVLNSESEFKNTVEWGVRNAEASRGTVEDAFQVGVTLQIARSPGMDMATVADHLDRNEYHRIPPRALMQFLWGLMKAGEFDPLEAHQQYENWAESKRRRNQDKHE